MFHGGVNTPTVPPARDLAREQAAKDRVRAAFASWAAGDGRGPMDLLAEDATWTIVGNSPIAGVYTSRREFLENAADLVNARLAAPMVPTVRGIYGDGDWIVALFDARATAVDGEPYRNTYTWYLRFGPGDDPAEIVEGIAFFDSIEVADLWRRVDPTGR